MTRPWRATRFLRWCLPRRSIGMTLIAPVVSDRLSFLCGDWIPCAHAIKLLWRYIDGGEKHLQLQKTRLWEARSKIRRFWHGNVISLICGAGNILYAREGQSVALPRLGRWCRCRPQPPSFCHSEIFCSCLCSWLC
jgi:hypothetical protein